MLLQTNSYIVPKEKRAEHSRLIRRFRQTLLRLGCDHFEVYEQVGSNWSNSESAGRYVQILRFLDRKHQLAVQAAERNDPTAQAVIADFCDLINFPYQQQQGLFAVGFYTSVLPVAPKRGARGELVSTVEHEVIDDPEAEKPYPGASDAPPFDEAAGSEEAILTEEPIAETEPVAEAGPIAEGEPLADDEPILEGETFADESAAPIPAEATAEESVISEEPQQLDAPLPVEPSLESPMEAAAESPEALTEQVAADEVSAESTGPAAEDPLADGIPEAEPVSNSNDDFMKLVGSDLGEEADDDLANGFIEGEIVDPEVQSGPDANGVHASGDLSDPFSDPEAEPAEHHKDRPPGW